MAFKFEESSTSFQLSTSQKCQKPKKYWKDNKLSGLYRRYDPLTGDLRQEGQFQYGQQTGKWKEIDEDGDEAYFQYHSIRVGAICGDGTLSQATGRGACSRHGGVAEWLYASQKHFINGTGKFCPIQQKVAKQSKEQMEKPKLVKNDEKEEFQKKLLAIGAQNQNLSKKNKQLEQKLKQAQATIQQLKRENKQIKILNESLKSNSKNEKINTNPIIQKKQIFNKNNNELDISFNSLKSDDKTFQLDISNIERQKEEKTKAKQIHNPQKLQKNQFIDSFFSSSTQPKIIKKLENSEDNFLKKVEQSQEKTSYYNDQLSQTSSDEEQKQNKSRMINFLKKKLNVSSQNQKK